MAESLSYSTGCSTDDKTISNPDEDVYEARLFRHLFSKDVDAHPYSFLCESVQAKILADLFYVDQGRTAYG